MCYSWNGVQLKFSLIKFFCVLKSKEKNKLFKMTNYHKPEAKTVQELRDIAHRLRIDSIQATEASKSG